MNDLTRFLAVLLRNPTVREQTFRLLDKRLRRELVQQRLGRGPRAVLEDQFQIVRNILATLEKAIAHGALSAEVAPKFLRVIGGLWFDGRARRRIFKQRYGHGPPAFLTISPTRRCNLRCAGCYAGSSRGSRETLKYDLINRIVQEKTELWGSHFTVLSGGEPLLYRSQGKTILDLAEEHRDNQFLIYTNGTLIDEATAERIANVGNITPAISLEGFEQETDARRGQGTHAKIRRAFRNLREVGVPYGISVTATRHNADLVVSDGFIDAYLDEMGASYVWIFQYMPIGRDARFDLQPTPRQRIAMWQKEWEIIRNRGVFLIDFWNCGTVSNGCVAAGTESGGYLHIDWNGSVMPCVSNPYYTHNIVEVYKKGGDLNSVLFTPLMISIRRWQTDYMLADASGNILCQCGVRDHYGTMREILIQHEAKPGNQAAAEVLRDEDYHRAIVAYGKQLSELSDPIWKREYLHTAQSD